MIVLTKAEAAIALGWSFDRDYPMLGEDEIALQTRLRAVVAPEPEPTCTADWCCTACEGSGWVGQDPCSDCYGTGHTHPNDPQGEPVNVDQHEQKHEPKSSEDLLVAAIRRLERETLTAHLRACSGQSIPSDYERGQIHARDDIYRQIRAAREQS